MDVRILGTLEVDDGARSVNLGLRKARMLFGALVLQAGIPVPTDRLAEAVWPNGPPARWETALYSHVSKLRRALEPDRAPRAQSGRIETAGEAYVLRLAPDELDAHRFERLAGEGRAALGHGDAERASEFLNAALAQWRGAVLADLADAPFVATEARRYDELRLVVTEERIEAELALGRHAAAVADLERLVAEHPLRERCWELLLLALYRSGRQADALRRYQDVRAILVGELGIEPGPGLRDLEGAILQHADGLQGERTRVIAAAAEPSEVALPGWLRPVGDAFVDRVDELDALRREWKRAANGERRMVVVAGEPGVGKTRLVREACGVLAVDGALVLGGRCAEEPLHVLQAFAEALGRLALADEQRLPARLPNDVAVLAGLVPELAPYAGALPAFDPDDQRYLMFRAVSAALDARVVGAPVLLVLDDLHWAPAPTVQLLAHLLRDTDRGSLLVIATVRDTEPNTDLDALIADLRRERRLERIGLRGLDAGDVDRLARARGADVESDQLYAMTEGNPFYVEELLRHVAESGGVLTQDAVPDSVRDTIARRLLRLPDPVRRLLGIASVAGLHFDLDIVAEAAGASVDDADDALSLAAQVGVAAELPGTVGAYAFSHALIRTVLRDGLGTARQARIHRRIGDALVASGHRDRLAEIAHHLLAAAADGSDATPGVQYAREAACEATARLRYDDAVAILDTARAVAEPAAIDLRLRCELLIDAAAARFRASDYDVVEELRDSAYAIAIELDDPEVIAYVLMESFIETSDRDNVWTKRVEAMIDRLDETAESRVILTAMLAQYYSHQPGERCRELGEWALARSDDFDPAARGQILEFVYRALGAWSPAERMLDLARAKLDAAEREGVPVSRLTAMSVLRRAYLAVGDLARSDDVGREYEAMVDALQQPRFRAGAEQRRAMRALFAGRFTEAEVHAEEAVTLQPTVEFLEGLAVQLFAIRFEQGRLVEVRDAVEAWAAAYDRPAWRLGYGTLLAEIGDHDGARAALASSLAAGFADVPRDELWFLALAASATIAVHLGDVDAAAPIYELLGPHASRVIVAGEGALCWGSIHRHLGPLAALLGETQRASMHFESSMSMHERLGAQPFLARDRLGYARLLRETGGDGVRSQALARTGLAIANQLGMRGVTERYSDLA
ncbi:MAG: BTAD domain-containing putative transcriptional regulator [Actinomycetota bacterium]|nr:BTAD domain-containing putative transcriptional regulator [Actinomycetota bacterium]